jgi:hypothetical protein
MFALGFITGVVVLGIVIWLLLRNPPNFLPW